ncbi:hypothetical protein LINPERHAP2_LOCUS7582 [Linum perenne]
MRLLSWSSRSCNLGVGTPLSNTFTDCAAEYLANLSHNLHIGHHLFSVAHLLLCSWLRYDLIGVARSRLIHVNN